MAGGWSNDQLDTLTLPQGAGTNEARIFLGSDIPVELSAYYAPHGYAVISAILFYTRLGGYIYIALIQNTPGPSIAIGSYAGDTVTERMFITSNIFDVNDLTWEDPTTGDDALGFWQPLTPLNGWVNRPGYQPLSVKRIPSPSKCAMIVGNFNPAGTTTDGILLCVLPPEFRPARAVGVPVQTSATVAGGQSPVLDIQTNGNCLLYGVRGAFTGFSAVYSLDA